MSLIGAGASGSVVVFTTVADASYQTEPTAAAATSELVAQLGHRLLGFQQHIPLSTLQQRLGA